MHIIFTKARPRLAAISVFVLCASVATAQDSAPTRANKMAYDAAMKCFVADGIVSGDYDKAGNAAKASEFEAKARTSFDAALKLGQTLGYSNEHIHEDFGLVQARELARMMTDGTYFRNAATTCKALGMM